MIAIHLRAPNSPSGNPQRLYVVLNENNSPPADVIDEGYRGIGALHFRYPGLYPTFTVEIPRAEYHSIKRAHNA